MNILDGLVNYDVNKEEKLERVLRDIKLINGLMSSGLRKYLEIFVLEIVKATSQKQVNFEKFEVAEITAQAESVLGACFKYLTVEAPDESYDIIDMNNLINDIFVELEQKIVDKKIEIIYNRLPKIFGITSQIKYLLKSIMEEFLDAYTLKEANLIEINYYVERDNFRFIFSNNSEVSIDFLSLLEDMKVAKMSGVNIATCKRIIEAHGGEVDSDNKEGFSFTLRKP